MQTADVFQLFTDVITLEPDVLTIVHNGSLEEVVDCAQYLLYAMGWPAVIDETPGGLWLKGRISLHFTSRVDAVLIEAYLLSIDTPKRIEPFTLSEWWDMFGASTMPIHTLICATFHEHVMKTHDENFHRYAYIQTNLPCLPRELAKLIVDGPAVGPMSTITLRITTIINGWAPTEENVARAQAILDEIEME